MLALNRFRVIWYRAHLQFWLPYGIFPTTEETSPQGYTPHLPGHKWQQQWQVWVPITICPQRLCKLLLIVSVYEKPINKEYWLFQSSKLLISADTENAFKPRRLCRAKLLLWRSGRLRECSYGYTHTCTLVVFHTFAMTYNSNWYSLYWIS